MKIGEFAKICNTKISVLRHYDKLNLLKPVFIDDFTGYRYYSQEQIAVFFRIAALKQAGFSLSEITALISDIKSNSDILELFEQKRATLLETLHNLDKAKELLIGENNMLDISFLSEQNKTYAKYAMTDCINIQDVYVQMDEALSAKDYQRISGYNRKDGAVICEVLKLGSDIAPLQETISLPFVNHEEVIGKWKAIGEYAVKEEFFEQQECRPNWYYEYPGILYFLPEGERYWCYGWTKGKLLIDTGDTSFVNDYEVEQIGAEKYMFISFKGFDYRRGGKPRILVLKQLDNYPYSAELLARKDDIDIPFFPDEKVLGKWKVFDFIRTKDEFSSEGSGAPPIFFKEIEFFEGGHCTSIYGDDIICGDDKQVWTCGYVLRKWNHCACAYEIRTVNNRDFLIMEWKSGDYRWGGFPTDYYVFVREYQVS